MSKVTVKEFTIERRTLLKWTAAALVAGKALDFEEVLAAGECKAVAPDKAVSDVTNGIINNSGIMPANNEFLYWIDGPMNDLLPGYSTAVPAAERLTQRAKLACTMNTSHNLTTYIESVTLVEVVSPTNSIPLAQVFYGPGAGLLQTGKAPYTVFENLALDSAKTYRVIYVKNNGDGKPVSVFQHTIANPRPSRFDFTHLLKSGADGVMGGEGHLSVAQMDALYLPWLIKELRETNQYKLASDTSGRSGFVTTPYSATFSNDAHTARARIIKVEPSGIAASGDFQIEIDFMHGDTASDAHYMRYFLVLDPVGRVLGGVRRNVGDGVTSKVLVRRGFHTPATATATTKPAAGATVRYTHDSVSYYDLFGTSSFLGAVPVFDAKLKAQYIDNLNILDCPYVQILTDDRLHAIARCIMRLR